MVILELREISKQSQMLTNGELGGKDTRCRGPAPAGSRGTLRMNGVGERETRRTGLDRAKSARGRERERERERERPDQTRPDECAAESGSCFIFHHSLYTLSWCISKGQISIQT